MTEYKEWPNYRVEKKVLKKIIWVVWVIQNTTTGQILFVVEWEDKSWKKKWQIFIPWWSVKDWENEYLALKREIEEETWIISEHLWEFEKKWIVNLNDWIHDINVSVYLIKTTLSNINSNSNHEIIKTYFDTLKNILSKTLEQIRPWLFECIFTALCSTKEDFKFPTTIDINNWLYQQNQYRILIEILKQQKIC